MWIGRVERRRVGFGRDVRRSDCIACAMFGLCHAMMGGRAIGLGFPCWKYRWTPECHVFCESCDLAISVPPSTELTFTKVKAITFTQFNRKIC